MSTTRLTFLYPHLFRAPRFGDSAASHAAQLACRSKRNHRSLPPPLRCQQTAGYATATSPKQSTFVARHGKAVEPKMLGGEEKPAAATRTEPKSEPKQPTDAKPTANTPAPLAAATESKPDAVAKKAPRPPAGDALNIPSVIELSAPAPPPGTEGAAGTKSSSGPMGAILHMGSPEALKQAHPHLSPTPYVHHFDTYSLVKRLEVGYTQKQAITAMKAVRALLAQNLDVAQERLVSRGDVDNETYLFRAACSELSTEIKNNRRIADEQMRQQRTLVQHEVDILTQSLNQELLTLNDNVKGMFNDRRMAVREEQKAAESAIQQIHYKISVTLNSDAKSDIEGLRWVLVRRGVLGLILMAFLSLGAIQYISYRSHEKQNRLKKQAEEAKRLRIDDGTLDRSSPPDAAAVLAAN